MLVSACMAQTTINGAGATFPYPMYSKWFSEYHNQHPDIQFNYQSIGSGGGIRQVTAGGGGVGVRAGPLSGERSGAAKNHPLHGPPVLDSGVSARTLARVRR